MANFAPYARPTMCTCWSLSMSKVSLEFTQQFQLLGSCGLGIHMTYRRANRVKRDVIHKQEVHNVSATSLKEGRAMAT